MDPIIQRESSGNKGIIAGIIVALLIAGGVFAVMKSSKEDDQTATTSTDTTSSIPTDTSTGGTPAVVTSQYKDGTYSAVGNYQSPGGAETIQVTLVLKDDIITDATVISDATRPISVTMQGQFIAGFKQQVIGKNISEVSLTKVSGSSLTPKGFNDAVAKIKVQAEV